MNFASLKLLPLSLVLCASHLSGQVIGETAFATDNTGTIYQFDAENPTVYASRFVFAAPPIVIPDNITFSPDGLTVYFTTGLSNEDVQSFPVSDPLSVTKLNTGIPNPIGIAIASDGTVGYVATDVSPSAGIYSFRIAGGSHNLLTAATTTIVSPLFIAISGGYAFVGDYIHGLVYSVTFDNTHNTYAASLIQSFGANNVGGLAISSDGYLYISTGHGGEIYRVPLSAPAGPLTQVMTMGPTAEVDGLAVSNDGKTLFYTCVNPPDPPSMFGGVYSLSTESLPVSAGGVTALTGLEIAQAIDITIMPFPTFSISPPTGLTGSQKKNDFVLVYERFNLLQWDPSPTIGVAGYYVYRNGSKIATLDSTTLSYNDHDIQKGITTTYAVSAFDSAGDESAQTPNIEIN